LQVDLLPSWQPRALFLRIPPPILCPRLEPIAKENFLSLKLSHVLFTTCSRMHIYYAIRTTSFCETR
jgi:hypothetical protein